MDFLTLLALGGVALWMFRAAQQRRRVALLGQHLGPYGIEKRMEDLTEAYLRCLGEDDAARRAQIWTLLEEQERSLAGQFARFAADFAKVDAPQARMGGLGIALPGLPPLPLAGKMVDLRALLALHARGIADAARNADGLGPRDKAFRMTAELFLMQHSCHWFCRSRNVASARLRARHQTTHAQVLAAVAPATAQAYRALTGL